jgi:hypothetical protein
MNGGARRYLDAAARAVARALPDLTGRARVAALDAASALRLAHYVEAWPSDQWPPVVGKHGADPAEFVGLAGQAASQAIDDLVARSAPLHPRSAQLARVLRAEIEARVAELAEEAP